MYRTLSALLCLSGIALSVLVPGGPIETRDFSHISPVILTVFNSYLTVLGIGSFMLAYFCYQQQRWAYKAAILAGGSYIWVYLVDLARLFPTSPTPMPTLLEFIEISGVLMALPLCFIAIRLLKHESHKTAALSPLVLLSTTRVLYLVLLIGIAALAIILYATQAAMGVS